MGEHAAVYGRPALVTALGLRTTAVAESPRGGDEEPVDELLLDLPDLSLRESCSWAQVLSYGERRRKEWRKSFDEPVRVGSLDSQPPDPAGVVKVALAEAMRLHEVDSPCEPRASLRVSVRSQLPRGSGFGSSASVAVAVAAAVLGALAGGGELQPDDERIEHIALETERRQHGRPSGVDHTAVIRGGFLSMTRREEGLESTELPRPEWLRGAVSIFDTGMPREATGEVVMAVRELKGRSPAAFEARLDDMERATSSFIAALGHEAPPWSALLDSVRNFEASLEALGVVPAEVSSIIRRIEDAGGAAKISGAGTLTGAAAGSLMVLWPPGLGAGDRTRPSLEELVGNLRPLEAELGVNGLELRGAVDA